MKIDKLILVNAENPYREEYKGKLVPLSGGILLEKEAAINLHRLLESIDGYKEIVPVSGWRSVWEQQEIWDGSVKENGIIFTRRFVAAPLHSEHHTGLAIDLALKKDDIDFICPEFPYSGICQRFREAAPQFGFIERYPENKEHITKISHEPWHFRYVGREAAMEIAERGICLEEFLNI